MHNELKVEIDSLLLEMNHSVGRAVKKSPVHRLSKVKANVMVTYPLVTVITLQPW